jgi:hypothetical protein
MRPSPNGRWALSPALPAQRLAPGQTLYWSSSGLNYQNKTSASGFTLCWHFLGKNARILFEIVSKCSAWFDTSLRKHLAIRRCFRPAREVVCTVAWPV